jgi:hypothetical protein
MQRLKRFHHTMNITSEQPATFPSHSCLAYGHAVHYPAYDHKFTDV